MNFGLLGIISEAFWNIEFFRYFVYQMTLIVGIALLIFASAFIYVLLIETPVSIIKKTLEFRRQRKHQQQIRERTIRRKKARREQHKNNKRRPI